MRAREKRKGSAGLRRTSAGAAKLRAPSSKSSRASATRSAMVQSWPTGRIRPRLCKVSNASGQGRVPSPARCLRATRQALFRSARVSDRRLWSSRWKTMVFSKRRRPSGPSSERMGMGRRLRSQMTRSCSSEQFERSWKCVCGMGTRVQTIVQCPTNGPFSHARKAEPGVRAQLGVSRWRVGPWTPSLKVRSKCMLLLWMTWLPPSRMAMTSPVSLSRTRTA